MKGIKGFAIFDFRFAIEDGLLPEALLRDDAP